MIEVDDRALQDTVTYVVAGRMLFERHYRREASGDCEVLSFLAQVDPEFLRFLPALVALSEARLQDLLKTLLDEVTRWGGPEDACG